MHRSRFPILYATEGCIVAAVFHVGLLVHRITISFLLVMSALCSLSFYTQLSAADWPCFRANNHRDATVEADLKTPLHVQWTYTPAQTPKPAWADPVTERHLMNFDDSPKPIIAAGKVFIGSSADDTLRAFDLKTGKMLWRFTTGGPIRFAPAFMDGHIYLGSDDGYVYCLDASSGSQRWQFRGGHRDDHVLGNKRMISNWPIRSGLIADKGVIYFTCGVWPAEGAYVFAVDAKTGKQIWCNDTSDAIGSAQAHSPAYAISGLCPQGYMAANDKYILVPIGRGIPARFKRDTGETAPAPHTERQAHSTANKMGGAQVIIGDDDIFYNANRIPPSKKWKIAKWSSFKLSDGALLTRRGQDKIPYPTYQEIKIGAVTFKAEGNEIAALDAKGNKKLWSFKTDGHPDGMAYANGHVVITTNTGKMYCFADKAGSAQSIGDSVKAVKQKADPFAANILKHLNSAGISKGYALLVGGSDVRTAEAIVSKTQLHVICVMSDKSIVQQERDRLLNETKYYGSRVSLIHVENLKGLPFRSYFANLVVIQSNITSLPQSELYRVLRPCGGMLFGASGVKADQKQLASAEFHADELVAANPMHIIRGKLKGAYDWNSKNTVDERVKWPLELSWYGGPAISQLLTKVQKSQMPRVANGRFYLYTNKGIVAADVYNGTQLWTFPIPEMKSKGGAAVAALFADDNYVYIKTGNKMNIVDAQRGVLVDQYPGELPSYAGTMARIPKRSKNDKYFDKTHSYSTGEKTEITYQKTYGCSAPAQSATMDFFRSGTFSFYDYLSDAGIRNYGGTRLGCGFISGVMPANGMVVVSDPGSHCVCNYSLETSFAMLPTTHKKNNDWAVFNDNQVREATQHKEYMLNIGAPGDQRDGKRNLWLAFPRTYGNIKSRITFAVPLRFENEELIQPIRVNPDRVEMKNTDKPWIYASMNKGVSKLNFDLTHFDPRYTIVSRPTDKKPSVDGKLDDPCWSTVGQVKDDRTKGLVSLRHDDKNVYLSCRQRIKSNVKRPPQMEKVLGSGDTPQGTIWKEQAFEVYFNVRRKIDFLHLGISESGKLHSGFMGQHIQTPKVSGVKIDAQLGDWDKGGIRANFEDGNKLEGWEIARLGWDEKGILLSGHVEKGYRHKRRPTGYLFIVADDKLQKNVQIRVNLLTKELKVASNETKGVESASKAQGEGFLFEARIPWKLLGLKPGSSERIMFYPIGFSEKDLAKNKDFFFGAKDFKALIRGVKGRASQRYDNYFRFVDDSFVDNYIVVDSRVKLPTGAVHIVSSYEHKEWDGAWTGTVNKGKEFIDYEMAIPFKTFEELGMDKNQLSAGFGGLNTVINPKRHQWIQSDWSFWMAVDSALYRVLYKDKKPDKAKYTVRMHFAELENIKAGERVFDIKIQDKVVASKVDVLAQSGGLYTATMKEFKDIDTQGNIQIEFISRSPAHPPVLNGLEVVRQE